jgi:DHA2 family multidrug resistance protein
MLRSAHLPAWMNLHTAHGMAALNAEITRQAAMVAYIDDFKMMMIITLAAIPLLALMRNPRMIAGAAPAKAEPVALD